MIGTATNTFARIRRTFQCDIALAYFPFYIVMFLFLFPGHTCASTYASDSKSLLRYGYLPQNRNGDDGCWQ